MASAFRARCVAEVARHCPRARVILGADLPTQGGFRGLSDYRLHVALLLVLTARLVLSFW